MSPTDQLRKHNAAAVARCRERESQAWRRGDWRAADIWITSALDHQCAADLFKGQS